MPSEMVLHYLPSGSIKMCGGIKTPRVTNVPQVVVQYGQVVICRCGQLGIWPHQDHIAKFLPGAREEDGKITWDANTGPWWRRRG